MTSNRAWGMDRVMPVVVLSPSFLGVFMGTAVVSLGAGGLAFAGWGRPAAPFF